MTSKRNTPEICISFRQTWSFIYHISSVLMVDINWMHQLLGISFYLLYTLFSWHEQLISRKNMNTSSSFRFFYFIFFFGSCWLNFHSKRCNHFGNYNVESTTQTLLHFWISWEFISIITIAMHLCCRDANVHTKITKQLREITTCWNYRSHSNTERKTN